MAQRTTNPSQPTARPSRATRRLNRAEQQALEIRQAHTITGTGVVPPVPVVEDTPGRPVMSTRTRRRRETSPALRANALTRDQEYGFIRTDLRRLLILSGALIVGMIAILLIIEAVI